MVFRKLINHIRNVQKDGSLVFKSDDRIIPLSAKNIKTDLLSWTVGHHDQNSFK